MTNKGNEPMNPTMIVEKEKYLTVGFEVAKRLAHAGYNLERPACTLTWGQIARELSRVLVDLGIQADQVNDETLCDLVEGVKETLDHEDCVHWREFIRIHITMLVSDFPESQEPDEGVFSEQFENATRLGDEEGYWVDGGASADLFDDF